MNTCCINCFADPVLRSAIRTRGKPKQDLPCFYCGSTDDLSIDPSELVHFFEPLLQIIESNESSEHYLWDLIDQEWALFCSSLKRHYELLKAIFEPIDSARYDSLLNGYVNFKSQIYTDHSAVQWRQFNHSIEHVNRYFHSDEVNMSNKLARILPPMEHEVKSDKVLYRARICTNRGDCFPTDQMGAPPKELATAGRANPAGIRYLYLANHQETTIHELRPSVLDSICIGEFRLTSDSRLIDFRTISPFQFINEEDFELAIRELPMLRVIGDQLGMPVHSSASAIKYSATQYVCELIKHNGWAGVIYRSSLYKSGYNIALFNPSDAVCHSVTLRKVGNIIVECE